MNLLTPELIKGSSLDGLSQAQLDALSSCASKITFKGGDFIFERGRESNRFFLITKGRVNIELYTTERGPKTIQTIGAGELLGTSWLLADNKWKSDAKADIETEAISFNAYKLKELCDEDLALGYALMRRLLIAISTRLEASHKQIFTLLQEKKF